MPYKLRISDEEVRAELESMGFSNVPDETVELFRRDLLKLIKSDLRKLREDRQLLEGTREETTYLSPPTTLGRHQHGKEKKVGPRISTPVLPRKQLNSRKTSNKDSKVQSHTATESDDDTTVESGYSDFESESSRPTYSSGDFSDSSSSSIYLSKDGRAGARPRVVDPSSRIAAFPSSRREFRNSAENSHRESQESAFDSHKVTEESSVDSHRGFKDSTIVPPKDSVNEKQREPVKPKKKATKPTETLPAYPSRPDPVNLYHFYKAHWDKFKTPGEDPRSKLRWEVRSKLFYSS